MGAVFDRVRTLASKRPPLPRLNSGQQRRILQGHVSIDILEVAEFVSQYETEMVYWLSEIRTLADPTLQTPGSIISESQASLDAQCLRAGTFERKNPCPIEASTSIQLSIYTNNPI
jgi:hypothetical protein